MYKIFMTVRNRLASTTKSISSIQKHSLLPHQLYVADNLTSYQVNEHFMYWSLLYQKGILHQLIFNTNSSVFNAFSKAVSLNQFGYIHEMDPEKNNVDFLVFLDNDMIVLPGWDLIIKNAFSDIKKYNLQHIKIVGQNPGGIMHKKDLHEKIGGYKAKTGRCGGSGFWVVKNDFFREIGFLDIPPLINLQKKHDQNYWVKLERLSKGKDYILGLEAPLTMHLGPLVGSICNKLTKNKNQKNVENLIKFEESEKYINSLSFDEFYNQIKDNKELLKW
jgi:hypothetical protein